MKIVHSSCPRDGCDVCQHDWPCARLLASENRTTCEEWDRYKADVSALREQLAAREALIDIMETAIGVVRLRLERNETEKAKSVLNDAITKLEAAARRTK